MKNLGKLRKIQENSGNNNQKGQKTVDQQIASLTKAKQSKTRPIKASELNASQSIASELKTRPIKASELNASQSIASELKTRLSKSQSDKNQSVNCQ